MVDTAVELRQVDWEGRG